MVDDTEVIKHILKNDSRNIIKQYYKSDTKQEIELVKLGKAFFNFAKHFSDKNPSLIVYISMVLPIVGRTYLKKKIFQIIESLALEFCENISGKTP